MKVKKITAILLSAILVGTVAGCGNTGTVESAGSESSTGAGSSEAESAVEAEEGNVSETDTAAAETSADDGSFVPALDTSAEVTLSVVGSWGNFEALDEVALNFQEYYPNVEVVYTQIKNGSSDIQNIAAAGTLDIYCVEWYNPDQEDKLVYTDLAEDLNETDVDFSNLNQNMLFAGQVDGKQLLVPVYQQLFGMMVNYTLLEDNGLSMPKNYAELTEVCDQLIAAGYEHPVFLTGSPSTRVMINMVMDGICRSDDPAAAAEAIAGGSDADGYFEAALCRLDEMEEKGYFDHEADDFEDDYESVILRFFEGDVPFVLYSSSKFSGTKKREAKSEAFTANPFSYGLEPAPLEDDGAVTYMTTLGSLNMGIYNESANLDYANEFLRFILRDDQMKVLAEIKNMPVTMEHTGIEQLSGIESMTDEQKIYPTEIGHYYTVDQKIGDAAASYVPGQTAHEDVLQMLAGEE